MSESMIVGESLAHAAVPPPEQLYDVIFEFLRYMGHSVVSVEKGIDLMTAIKNLVEVSFDKAYSVRRKDLDTAKIFQNLANIDFATTFDAETQPTHACRTQWQILYGCSEKFKYSIGLNPTKDKINKDYNQLIAGQASVVAVCSVTSNVNTYAFMMVTIASLLRELVRMLFL